jgi:hypothetical protein
MRTFLPGLLLLGAAPAFAISTTFTYQGQLFDAGQPAQASYDLQFELQTQAGAAVGAPLVREDVAVQGGLFAVELDFGPSITAADYQLRIGVRPAASTGAFTLLAPVTKIRPTPQAQVAGVAAEAVTVSVDSIGSSSIANGSIAAADVDSSQIQRRIAGSCAAGDSLRSIASDGTVSCNPAAIYGDGSRGDFVAAPGVNLLSGGNLQFNNITVPAGASLFVPSGALIKALGTVTIQGAINVQGAAQPSSYVPGPYSQVVPAPPSYFGSEAHTGASDTFAAGVDMTVIQARAGSGARAPKFAQSTPSHYVLHPAYLGGGPGGNAEGVGGEGGGFAAIVARGSISISGSITAIGASAAASISGGGGGAGGVLVLASRSTIQNTGTLLATGGAGGNGGSTDGGGVARAWGPGGGGGGGIVHLIAPSISAGTVQVGGGSGGTAPAPITYAGATFMTSIGGGGGGGSYGAGGNGSTVNGATNTRQYTWGANAQAGGAGLLIQTLADPSTLF